MLSALYQTASLILMKLIPCASLDIPDFTIGTATAPNNNECFWAAAYDETNDTIILMGGRPNPQQFAKLKDDTFSDIGPSPLNLSLSLQPEWDCCVAYTRLHDDIWVMAYGGIDLISFNTKSYNPYYPVRNWGGSPEFNRGCVTSFREYILLIGASSAWYPDPNGGTYDTYNIKTYNTTKDGWINTSGPEFNTYRIKMSCAVVGDKLYIIGGLNDIGNFSRNLNRTDTIEWINYTHLLLGSGAFPYWQYLNSTLTEPLQGTNAVAYGTDIIVIGGEAQGNISRNWIHIIDTNAQSCIVHGTGLAFATHDAVTVMASNTLYIFSGNRVANHSNDDKYQYATLPVLNDPTISPTSIPTSNPSPIPTLNPSKNPSQNPTTLHPSNPPTTETSTTMKTQSSNATLQPADTTSMSISTYTSLIAIEIATLSTSSESRSNDPTTNTVLDGQVNDASTTTEHSDHEIGDAVHNESTMFYIVCAVLGICCVCLCIVGISIEFANKRKMKRLHRSPECKEVLSDSEDDARNKKKMNIELASTHKTAFGATRDSVSTTTRNRRLRKDNRNKALIKYWLKNVVKLPSYYDIFTDNGYEALEFIQEIYHETELEEMGIGNVVHRAKIMSEIKILQKNRKYENNVGFVYNEADLVHIIEAFVTTRTGEGSLSVPVQDAASFPRIQPFDGENAHRLSIIADQFQPRDNQMSSNGPVNDQHVIK